MINDERTGHKAEGQMEAKGKTVVLNFRDNISVWLNLKGSCTADGRRGNIAILNVHTFNIIVEYITNGKLKRAGHIVWIKDNRWTSRSTEWQITCVRPKQHWRDDIVMWLWGYRGQYGQGQQRSWKVGGLWWRASSCSGMIQSRIVQKTTTKYHGPIQLHWPWR